MDADTMAGDPVLFDIPALLGKSPEEIERILGAPAETHEDGETLWKTWPAPGTLRAFKVWVDKATGRIERYEIRFDGVRHEDMPRDPQVLIRAGNLRDDDPRYTLRIRESLTVLGQPRGLYVSVYAMMPKPA